MERTCTTNNKGKINDFKSIFPNDNVIGISELIKDFDVEEEQLLKRMHD